MDYCRKGDNGMTMENDDLGNRMKQYESKEDSILIQGLPIVIRLDGRAFHSFTHGLKRPFDDDFRSLMVETTRKLVEETNAVVGYTQSDEISLILLPETQQYFGGRVNKINSLLGAFASVWFNHFYQENWFKFPNVPGNVLRKAYFDCRCFNVPTLNEAANHMLWREIDATKNSISAAAQAYFSPTQLDKLNSKQKQELLFQEKQINWNDYPTMHKKGVYLSRQRVKHKFSLEEIEKLPPMHNARKNPDMEFERVEIKELEIPPINSIANKSDVLFYGKEPVLRTK